MWKRRKCFLGTGRRCGGEVNGCPVVVGFFSCGEIGGGFGERKGTVDMPPVEKGRSVGAARGRRRRGCWLLLLDRRWRLIEEVVSPCSAVREEAGAEGEGFGEMGRRETKMAGGKVCAGGCVLERSGVWGLAVWLLASRPEND